MISKFQEAPSKASSSTGFWGLYNNWRFLKDIPYLTWSCVLSLSPDLGHVSQVAWQRYNCIDSTAITNHHHHHDHDHNHHHLPWLQCFIVGPQNSIAALQDIFKNNFPSPKTPCHNFAMPRNACDARPLFCVLRADAGSEVLPVLKSGHAAGRSVTKHERSSVWAYESTRILVISCPLVRGDI